MPSTTCSRADDWQGKQVLWLAVADGHVSRPQVSCSKVHIQLSSLGEPADGQSIDALHTACVAGLGLRSYQSILSIPWLTKCLREPTTFTVYLAGPVYLRRNHKRDPGE